MNTRVSNSQKRFTRKEFNKKSNSYSFRPLVVLPTFCPTSYMSWLPLFYCVFSSTFVVCIFIYLCCVCIFIYLYCEIPPFIIQRLSSPIFSCLWSLTGNTSTLICYMMFCCQEMFRKWSENAQEIVSNWPGNGNEMVSLCS